MGAAAFGQAVCGGQGPAASHYSDVSVSFVNHALEFADYVGMIVRHHVGNRQVRGRHLYTMPLGRDAIRNLTDRSVPYAMEWRVWEGVGHSACITG